MKYSRKLQNRIKNQKIMSKIYNYQKIYGLAYSAVRKGRCPERKKAGIFNYGGIPMFKGTVKWFNNQKGYGFIQDESGKDIFVHYTGLNMPGFKSLEEGNEVEFDIVQGEKGPQASNVVKLQG